MSSQETLDKAREMLCEMVAMADDQPFNLSHSDYIMRMWNAFNKGREYEAFVSKAEREGR